MMDELDDDIPDEFKGTLQLTRDESKNDIVGKSGIATPTPVDDPAAATANVLNESDSCQKTLLNNFTQKITPLVRKFSNISQVKTVNHSAIALKVETPTNYFTYREGIIDKAVNDCVADVITEADGALVGKFLLTEINLWDSDKERLILLMTKCVICVKYDFIALKILEFRRIVLKDLDNIVVGELVYPPGSLVPDRKARGVRLMWNRGEPLKFAVKWNPFNDNVPICTLTSHPLHCHAECDDTAKMFFSCDEFLEKLRVIMDREDINIVIHHNPIVLQNYVGISSLIHNRNDFGFFKVRGKFSF